MAVTLTTDGSTHITERNTGAALTDAFNAMELGQGNNIPAVADNRSQMTSRIVSSLRPLASGYPVLGDSDVRNEGRATDVWSWKVVYPEGTQFVASNLIVTNYVAGAPSATEHVLVHADTVVYKRADQELHLWVNVSTAGAASVVAHLEDGEPLVEQIATWRAQSLVLSGAPGATPASNGRAVSRLTEGDQVWTGARLLTGAGGVMTRTDVLGVDLSVYTRSGEREWVLADEMPLGINDVMASAPIRTDPRWRGSQGYTFAHAWVPPLAWGSKRTRLEYRITGLDGNDRCIIHEVEWSSIRAR